MKTKPSSFSPQPSAFSLSTPDPEDALQEHGCVGAELLLTAFDLVTRHPRLTLAVLALFLVLFVFLVAP